MAEPSKNWREQIGADEAERYARHARDLAAVQQRDSTMHGPGRMVHRQQQLGLPAEFEVLADLPEAARHGFFARPGQYEAQIRLSNAGAKPAPDRKPDVRGFAIKVLGVNGLGALGTETTSQNFVLINRETFAFPKSEEFVQFVLAFSGGGLSLLRHLLKRYGVLGALQVIKKLGASVNKPFLGFASEPFFSAAPIACGPYAARVRLLPAQPQTPADKRKSWAADMLERLDRSPLQFDLQLQFFVNETLTPIEDASVNWSEDIAPYVTVGRLTIPQRKEWADRQDALQKEIESGVFDPWRALAEHRPLGDVMRARKVIYFGSQKGRSAQG